MRIPQIDNNPLRVLGVYANSTLREIEQNKAQLRAFARVGQKVELPLWLKGFSLLPPMPDITEEMVQQAQSQSSLQDDRDDYARFWFERDENLAQVDEKVFSLLCNNQVDEACHLLQQRTDHAAMKNLLLLSVMKDDWSMIADCASKCYEGDLVEFRIFMKAVVKASDVANDVNSKQLLDYFHDEFWRSEMVKVLTNNHRHFMDGIFDQLRHISTDNAKLIKKAYDEAIAAKKHVIAICNLNGLESVIYQFYLAEYGKMVCTTLYKYALLQPYHAHELRWVCNEFFAWWSFVKIDDSDDSSLLAMKTYMEGVRDLFNRKSGVKSGSTSTINVEQKDYEGCTIPTVIVIAIILLFLFGSGSKKSSTTYYGTNQALEEFKSSTSQPYKTHNPLVKIDETKFYDYAAKKIITSGKDYDNISINEMISRWGMMDSSESYRRDILNKADSLKKHFETVATSMVKPATNKQVDTLQNLWDALQTVIEYNKATDSTNNKDE